MTDVTIRLATANDVATICKLSSDTFYETFADRNSEADMQAFLQTAYNPEKISAELVEPGSSFYLALIDGVPAGYTRLRLGSTEKGIMATKPMELERIYVLQTFQGIKVGHALLQHAINTAKAAGCDGVWLGVWEHNDKAIRFYERAGFRACGSHIFWVGSDPQTDLVMELSL